MAATTISIDLISRIREFYTMAYQETLSNEREQAMPDNKITDYAIPSYILAVAAVEAFVNEFILAIGSDFLTGSSFAKLSQDEIQQFRKSNLGDKLIKLPALVFDQEVFNRGRQPFQDMNYLINVRDSFVHYKMGFEAEYKGAFEYLIQKGIALNSPNGPSRFWVSDLSTVEGIRWAHNTALKIMKEIIDTAIKTNRHPLLIAIGTKPTNFFHQIPDPSKNRELWFEWLKFHCKWEKVEKSKSG